jgi:hypothetical protein
MGVGYIVFAGFILGTTYLLGRKTASSIKNIHIHIPNSIALFLQWLWISLFISICYFSLRETLGFIRFHPFKGYEELLNTGIFWLKDGCLFILNKL